MLWIACFVTGDPTSRESINHLDESDHHLQGTTVWGQCSLTIHLSWYSPTRSSALSFTFKLFSLEWSFAFLGGRGWSHYILAETMSPLGTGDYERPWLSESSDQTAGWGRKSVFGKSLGGCAAPSSEEWGWRPYPSHQIVRKVTRERICAQLSLAWCLLHERPWSFVNFIILLLVIQEGVGFRGIIGHFQKKMG